MIEVRVQPTRAERLIRAYCEGAESGMIEARGYGLSEDEQVEALREAVKLYGDTPDYEIAS